VDKHPKSPDNTPKALERWSNEGGAPRSGDVATRKNRKDSAAVNRGQSGGAKDGRASREPLGG
jgi:hypothetical protein